jgi:uncharacterized cupredoxin-like copper-binding protein
VRAAAAALLAAAALVALASPAGAAGIAGASANGPCVWKKHSKRVTKKVRRHGKVRRTKRVKRWWTCVPVAAAAPAPAPGPTPQFPEPPDEEPKLAHIGVKAKEWSYTLSRPEVTAGEVEIELQNQGEDPHDLNLEPDGAASGEPLQIPITGPSEHKSARFTLPAGTYRLWCDLDEHDERGMHATLTVTGS